ncbi:MAG: ABC transporter ATP-binding protein [Bacilli bacterium]|nr:ABC transporter ATP-binding protein [Bacilli bacterium]
MQKINKIYDNGFHAVHDFSIDIKQHEFIVFVGPSGCGKSTTLRMIAGLEDISGGNLFIDGDYMNDIAPKDRNIAMVFQSYALYPHMTVYENMAFPLKIMHLPKEEIDKRVMDAAHILQIEDLLDRKPKALSGGQRQRVALGRAIVHHAKVLLMDEPLSNLDAKLRVQMRSEIVKLHNNLGATTIYVTHDQTEAMTMATRIVIMKDGYIQQIGAPIDIFNHPVNKFVAGFIGSPAMNFFPATYQDGKVTFVTGQKLTIPADLIKDKTIPEKVIFGIRPEDIHEGDGYHASLYPDAIFDAKVILAELLGNEYYVHTNFAFQDVIARFPSEHKLSPKDDIKFAMNLERCHLFDPQSEIAIF